MAGKHKFDAIKWLGYENEYEMYVSDTLLYSLYRSGTLVYIHMHTSTHVHMTIKGTRVAKLAFHNPWSYINARLIFVPFCIEAHFWLCSVKSLTTWALRTRAFSILHSQWAENTWEQWKQNWNENNQHKPKKSISHLNPKLHIHFISQMHHFPCLRRGTMRGNREKSGTS